ncbi:DUF2730 family protein [Epibacterium ulvae]|uniref:DUF2730 family protein n=1 Tax=Epibacterium ulvae TaxID=1156985 RepID=UPI002490D2E0|nr:DUF2730 family protein [Epibacterium ulvae]
MSLDADLIYKLASLALSLIAMVYAWFATRRKDLDKRLHDGSKRMDQHDLDIQSLKQSLESLPARQEFHELQILMTELGGDMKAILEQLKSVGDSQRRMEKTVGAHETYLREMNK